MKFESEEEIEDWFERRKEELEEEFYKDLRDGKKREESRAKFEKKLKSLIKEYNDNYTKFWESQEKREKLREPIDNAKERINELEKHVSEKWNEWREHIQEEWDDFMMDAEKKKLDLELKWHRFRHRREESREL